jgi:hypothetical protein
MSERDQGVLPVSCPGPPSKAGWIKAQSKSGLLELGTAVPNVPLKQSYKTVKDSFGLPGKMTILCLKIYCDKSVESALADSGISPPLRDISIMCMDT